MGWPSFSHYSFMLPIKWKFSSTGKQYDVEVKIIQADFSEGLQVYAHIEKELQDMDVGILGKQDLTYLEIHSTYL